MADSLQPLETHLEQPWKKWVAKEIASQQEAELDPAKKAQQKKLFEEYEKRISSSDAESDCASLSSSGTAAG